MTLLHDEGARGLVRVDGAVHRGRRRDVAQQHPPTVGKAQLLLALEHHKRAAAGDLAGGKVGVVGQGRVGRQLAQELGADSPPTKWISAARLP